MKKLGHILHPEEYAPVTEEIKFADSISALEYFLGFCPPGGTVILGQLSSNSIKYPNVLSWFYYDTVHDIVMHVPVFDIPIEELADLKILNIEVFDREIITFWNNVPYCSVFTTTGETCVRRSRMFLDEENAALLFMIQNGHEEKPVSMYPVRLYSISQKKFVVTCWAVLWGDDENVIYWHPICKDEEESICSLAAEDLEEYPISVGDIITIGGDSYKLHFHKGRETYFFVKQRSIEEAKFLFYEEAKLRSLLTREHSEDDQQAGNKNCIFIPFVPKQQQEGDM